MNIYTEIFIFKIADLKLTYNSSNPYVRPTQHHKGQRRGHRAHLDL